MGKVKRMDPGPRVWEKPDDLLRRTLDDPEWQGLDEILIVGYRVHADSFDHIVTGSVPTHLQPSLLRRATHTVEERLYEDALREMGEAHAKRKGEAT